MVHRQQQHVPLAAEPQQRRPEQRPRPEVERPLRLRRREGGRRGLPRRRGQLCEIDHRHSQRPGRRDRLAGLAVEARERGAQRLVAAHHLGEDPAQHPGLERSLEAQRRRNVVDRRAGRELVEEPEPGLRERQGQRPRPLHPPQHRDGGRSVRREASFARSPPAPRGRRGWAPRTPPAPAARLRRRRAPATPPASPAASGRPARKSYRRSPPRRAPAPRRRSPPPAPRPASAAPRLPPPSAAAIPERGSSTAVEPCRWGSAAATPGWRRTKGPCSPAGATSDAAAAHPPLSRARAPASPDRPPGAVLPAARLGRGSTTAERTAPCASSADSTSPGSMRNPLTFTWWSGTDPGTPGCRRGDT